MSANDKQFGGDHYKKPGAEEHWDFAYRHNYNPFEYSSTKYVLRCWKKNGVEDLKKAKHHLEKLIEVTGSKIGDKLTCIQDMVRFSTPYDIDPTQRNILNMIHVGLWGVAVMELDEYIAEHEMPREYVNPDL